LAKLPGLLPENTWIDNLSVQYTKNPAANKQKKKKIKKSKKKKKGSGVNANKFGLTVEFSGYVYLPDIKEQFGLVNNLLQNIKENEEFSSFFKKIDLQDVKAKNLKSHNVTEFKITLK